MLNIPFKALKIGAERIYETPIKYSKSRVSGSNKTTYYIHSKGACMPGLKDKFTTNSKTKPGQNADLINNKVIQAFKKEKSMNVNETSMGNQGKSRSIRRMSKENHRQAQKIQLSFRNN